MIPAPVWRRAAALALAGSLAACSGSAPEPAAEPAPEPAPEVERGPPRLTGPNVVLLVTSTTRADRLSLYGYARPTSPGLDRLAASSVVYERCISPATWFLPAHASLFTGRPVRDHGADGSRAQSSPYRGNTAVGEEARLLTEVMRRHGYRTAGLSNNAWFDSRLGLQQGFDDFKAMSPRNPEGDWEDDGARDSNRVFFEWLDGRENAEQRFFYYLNYIEPTMPYAPPAAFERRFLRAGADRETVQRLRTVKHPREVQHMLEVPGRVIPPDEIELLSDLYDAELAYVDSRITEVVEGLRERGLEDETLLVIVGDQGEHLGEHGLLHHKMSVFQPLLRVPLLLRWPGTLAPARIPSLVQSTDLFATLLELCEIEAPTPDTSVVLPLADGDPPAREVAVSELEDPTAFLVAFRNRFPGVDTSRFEHGLLAVQDQRFKYIRSSDGTERLYDLDADPGELRDALAEHPEVAQRLRAQADAFADAAP